jgi:hypothetical protein
MEMKQEMYKKKSIYLNQEKHMNGLWIGREHECEVESSRRVLHLLVTAEGDAFGDTTRQGRFNADGLYHHER